MPLKKVNVVVQGTMFVPPGADDHPEHPIYIPIDPPPDSGLSPEHPIYIPVYPDQGLPGSQPGPDNTLPGAQPGPDNTLPGDQPRPDQGLPGQPPGVNVPTFPTHPIYLPVPVPPDSGLSPEHPIYIPIYPSQGPGFPTHPIEIPPPGLSDAEVQKLVEFLLGNLPPHQGTPEPTPVKGKR
jgi:hypothetical protein